MRESSLVGERVEGVCDGVGGSWLLMQYNYRRREEALCIGDAMKVAVVGDSYMSAVKNKNCYGSIGVEGKHFTELLAKKFDWELVSLARGGSTNNVIRSQIQYAIDVVKPDFVFVGTTFPERLEIPVEGKTYDLSRGLENFNYDRTKFVDDQSFFQLNFDNTTMEFDSINSFIGQDGQPIFDSSLSDEQRLILKKYYIHNFSKSWKSQLDSWIVQSGCFALKEAKINFSLLLQNFLKYSILMNDFKIFEKEVAMDVGLCPWDYPSGDHPFHTSFEDQEKLAECWSKYFI